MIRASLLALGLILGLALAVLAEGRMAHLRGLAGARLPDWTQVIGAESSLLVGHAEFLAGTLPLSVQWRLTGLSRLEPFWQLQLSSPGLHLEGDLRPGTDGVTQLDGLRGHLDPAALAVWERPPAFAANLQITRASATFSHDSGTVSGLRIEGFAEGVTLDQSTFGDGRFEASIEPDGRWQIRLSLLAGQADIEAAGDALGGILSAHVHPDLEAQLPPEWGKPLPASENRVMVSYLLPLIVREPS